MLFEEGEEVEIRVRFKVPNKATEGDVAEFVDDALRSVYYGYGEDNPFYGFDDDSVKVMEVTK